MKFSIVAINHVAGTSSLILDTADEATFLQVIAACRNRPEAITQAVGYGNSKAIKVCGVEESSETGLQPGDSFDSSKQASLVLGFKYNAVASALNAARHMAEKTATLRGVTFCYASDYEAVALQDAKVD